MDVFSQVTKQSILSNGWAKEKKSPFGFVCFRWFESLRLTYDWSFWLISTDMNVLSIYRPIPFRLILFSFSFHLKKSCTSFTTSTLSLVGSLILNPWCETFFSRFPSSSPEHNYDATCHISAVRHTRSQVRAETNGSINHLALQIFHSINLWGALLLHSAEVGSRCTRTCYQF